MSVLTEVTGPRALDQLAEDVRRHHKAVERHARSMLDEAIAAGEALIEAKGLLQHGEFGPWLTYCGVSRRSASLYMKLAREKGNVAVLEADSIRAALDALAGKPRTKPNPPDFGLAFPEKSAAWQHARWLEAMTERGRDPDELKSGFCSYCRTHMQYVAATFTVQDFTVVPRVRESGDKGWCHHHALKVAERRAKRKADEREGVAA